MGICRAAGACRLSDRMAQPSDALPLPPPPPAGGHGLHPLSMGRIAELTMRMLRFRWRLFLGAVLLPLLPVHVLGAIVQIPFVQTMNRWLMELESLEADIRAGRPVPPITIPAGVGEALLALVAVGLVSWLAGLVAIGAATHAAGAVYSGTPVTARAAIRRALRRLPTLLGASLLQLLGLVGTMLVGAVFTLALFTGVGGGLPAFLALIVIVGTIAAALFLAVRWSLMIQAVMLEDQGALAAMGRSWRLVVGSSWRVLGYLVTLGLVIGLLGALVTQIAQLLLGGAGAPIDAGEIVVQTLIGGLVSMLLAPVLPIAFTLLYFDLRWRRGELAPGTAPVPNDAPSSSAGRASS